MIWQVPGILIDAAVCHPAFDYSMVDVRQVLFYTAGCKRHSYKFQAIGLLFHMKFDVKKG